MAGEDGQRVGADLVGGVAVRGDPVAAHDDRVDHARRHRRTGRAVDDQPVRECPPRPSSQAVRRPPWRSGRASRREDLVELARGVERVDDPERGAVAARREAAGVAVGQDPRAAREVARPWRPIAAQAAASSAWIADRLGERRGADRRRRRPARASDGSGHPLDRPAEVHGGRPGSADPVTASRAALGARRRASGQRRLVEAQRRRRTRPRCRSPGRRGPRASGSRRPRRRPCRGATRRARRAGGAGR